MHGHLVGDEALVAAAQALRDSVRTSDVVGRYGGEEFLVLLRRADRSVAATVAERCRAAIARREVRLADGPVRMSASIGVASHVSDEPLDAFLGRVDGALHAAKREGRDRVVEASAPTPLEAQA